jgi:hypothetical protein
MRNVLIFEPEIVVKRFAAASGNNESNAQVATHL